MAQRVKEKSLRISIALRSNKYVVTQAAVVLIIYCPGPWVTLFPQIEVTVNIVHDLGKPA